MGWAIDSIKITGDGTTAIHLLAEDSTAPTSQPPDCEGDSMPVRWMFEEYIRLMDESMLWFICRKGIRTVACPSESVADLQTVYVTRLPRSYRIGTFQ